MSALHEPATASTRRSLDRRPATPNGRDWANWAAAALQAFCLNLLWLLCCLPVVTIPASTTAMIMAVRRWRLEGEAPEGRRFLADCRQAFGCASLTAVLMLALAAFLALDVLAIGQMGGQRRVMLVAWMAIVAGLSLAGVFCFAVLADRLLVGVPTSVRSLGAVVRGSARLAVHHPVRAILALGVAAVAAALVSVSPIALLVIGVLAATLVERLGRPEQAAA